MENKRSAPEMLPIMEHNGQSWLIDDRLGQFREAWNPHHFVDFGSAQGGMMPASWGWSVPTTVQ